MGFSISPNSSGVASVPGVTRFPQLEAEGIADFIDQYSVAIQYWKAIACPCTNALSGQPTISCHQCRGLGWFHLDSEKDAKYSRAMVHNRSGRKSKGTGGEHISGGCSVTLFPGVIPGDGDLVQMCVDIEVVNNEYHTKGSTLTDGSTAETLRFRDIVCVETILYQDETFKKILSLPNTEWSFDAAGRKIHSDLPVGTKYSVRYLARPEYIVLGDTAKPLHRAMHDEGLPEPQRTRLDVVFPYNVSAVRLDRAIIQRQRGAVDFNTPSTHNSASGRGPFK